MVQAQFRHRVLDVFCGFLTSSRYLMPTTSHERATDLYLAQGAKDAAWKRTSVSVTSSRVHTDSSPRTVKPVAMETTEDGHRYGSSRRSGARLAPSTTSTPGPLDSHSCARKAQV